MNQNANIDDIMSSIRTGVESESGKAPSGSADLLEQAAQEATAADAAAEGVAENSDDDILELTPAEMASPAAAAPATPAEGITDILGVATLSGADEAADEFDKLLAEIGEEKKTRAAAVEAQKEALLADIEPLGTPEAAADTAADIAPEVPAETMPVEAPPALEEPPVFQAAPAAALSAEGAPTVGMIEGENGSMNLVLPAEVLIQALRPMVQQWLQQNLAPITEKLVQAEIAKLNS